MGIRAANREYERWLARQLHGEIVDGDLGKKHKKMSESAFGFLRATYWRWAEAILDVCPDLANAPPVLAIGDIHLENFGTWTDREGRIIWGVNDYDEAAEMPYILDLVRLAASAALAATPSQLSLKAICTNLLEGYEHGLEAPEPFVLDRQHMWLRTRFVVERSRTRHVLAEDRQPVPRRCWPRRTPSSRRRAGSRCLPARCRTPRSP